LAATRPAANLGLAHQLVHVDNTNAVFCAGIEAFDVTSGAIIQHSEGSSL
jgi:hypothetical protein